MASAVVIWDWRYVLIALLFVQFSVGVSLANTGEAPIQWMIIQFAVMALACTIIALSAHQAMPSSRSARQSGTWWLRFMAIALLFGGWRIIQMNPTYLKSLYL